MDTGPERTRSTSISGEVFTEERSLGLGDKFKYNLHGERRCA